MTKGSLKSIKRSVDSEKRPKSRSRSDSKSKDPLGEYLDQEIKTRQKKSLTLAKQLQSKSVLDSRNIVEERQISKDLELVQEDSKDAATDKDLQNVPKSKEKSRYRAAKSKAHLTSHGRPQSSQVTAIGSKGWVGKQILPTRKDNKRGSIDSKMFEGRAQSALQKHNGRNDRNHKSERKISQEFNKKDETSLTGRNRYNRLKRSQVSTASELKDSAIAMLKSDAYGPAEVRNSSGSRDRSNSMGFKGSRARNMNYSQTQLINEIEIYNKFIQGNISNKFKQEQHKKRKRHKESIKSVLSSIGDRATQQIMATQGEFAQFLKHDVVATTKDQIQPKLKQLHSQTVPMSTDQSPKQKRQGAPVHVSQKLALLNGSLPANQLNRVDQLRDPKKSLAAKFDQQINQVSAQLLKKAGERAVRNRQRAKTALAYQKPSRAAKDASYSYQSGVKGVGSQRSIQTSNNKKEMRRNSTTKELERRLAEQNLRSDYDSEPQFFDDQTPAVMNSSVEWQQTRLRKPKQRVKTVTNNHGKNDNLMQAFHQIAKMSSFMDEEDLASLPERLLQFLDKSRKKARDESPPLFQESGVEDQYSNQSPLNPMERRQRVFDELRENEQIDVRYADYLLTDAVHSPILINDPSLQQEEGDFTENQEPDLDVKEDVDQRSWPVVHEEDQEQYPEPSPRKPTHSSVASNNYVRSSITPKSERKKVSLKNSLKVTSAIAAFEIDPVVPELLGKGDAEYESSPMAPVVVEKKMQMKVPKTVTSIEMVRNQSKLIKSIQSGESDYNEQPPKQMTIFQTDTRSNMNSSAEKEGFSAAMTFAASQKSAPNQASQNLFDMISTFQSTSKASLEFQDYNIISQSKQYKTPANKESKDFEPGKMRFSMEKRKPQIKNFIASPIPSADVSPKSSNSPMYSNIPKLKTPLRSRTMPARQYNEQLIQSTDTQNFISADEFDMSKVVRCVSQLSEVPSSEFIDGRPYYEIEMALADHVEKTWDGEFLYFEDIFFQVEENDMLMVLPQSEELRHFKANLPKRLEQLATAKQNEIDQATYESFIDLAWKNGSNHYNYLHLLNPDALDRQQQTLSLFDIKTIAGLSGIYDQIQWNLLEDKAKSHKKRVSVNSSWSEQIEESLGDLLFDFVETFENFNDPKNFQSIDVPAVVKNSIYDQNQQVVGRVLPIRLHYKINVMKKDTFDFVYSTAFSNRYRSYIELMAFGVRILNNEHRIECVEDKMFKQDYGYRFIETESYASLNKQHIMKSINRCLFSYSIHKVSLLHNDMSNDLLLMCRINELHCFFTHKHFATKRVFKVGNFKFTESERTLMQDARQAKGRPQSPDPKQIAFNRHHYLVKQALFEDDKEHMARNYDSDDEDQPGREYRYLGNYRRQGALDIWDRKRVTFMLQQGLESRLMVIPDSVSLFYSRIETFIDVDDQDLNSLSRQFAYKAQVIRTSSDSRYNYEVFVPCLKDKNQRKIDIQELKTLKYLERKLPMNATQARRSVYLTEIFKAGGVVNTTSGLSFMAKSPLLERLKMNKVGIKDVHKVIQTSDTSNWQAYAKIGGGIRDVATSFAMTRDNVSGLSAVQAAQKVSFPEKKEFNQIAELIPEVNAVFDDNFESDSDMADVDYWEIAEDKDQFPTKQQEKKNEAIQAQEDDIVDKIVRKLRNTKIHAAQKEPQIVSALDHYENIKKKQDVNKVKPVYTIKMKSAEEVKNGGGFNMLDHKIHVDKLVKQVNSSTLKDNAKYYDELMKELEFIENVRAKALKKFHDNFDDYLASKEGNVLEANLTREEDRLQRLKKIIKSNIGYHHSVSLDEKLQRRVTANFDNFNEAVQPKTGLKMLLEENVVSDVSSEKMDENNVSLDLEEGADDYFQEESDNPYVTKTESKENTLRNSLSLSLGSDNVSKLRKKQMKSIKNIQHAR